MFKKINIESPLDRVRREILRAVLSGRLKPGDKLSPEHVLARQFGVSITTVRGSMKALKAVGLLETRRGRDGGTYIGQSNSDAAREALLTFLYLSRTSHEQLYEVRVMLEPEIARLAAITAEPEPIDELKRNLVAFGDKLKRSEPTRDIEIEFHRILTRALKNQLIGLVLESIFTFQTEFKKTLPLPPAFAKDVYQEHAAIYDLIAARDGEGAYARMRAHMKSTAAFVGDQVNPHGSPSKGLPHAHSA